jgi:hypothetical protein
LPRTINALGTKLFKKKKKKKKRSRISVVPTVTLSFSSLDRTARTSAMLLSTGNSEELEAKQRAARAEAMMLSLVAERG